MEQRVIVSVADGLHARSAAEFVQLAADQPAIVFISANNSDLVETTSILAVMNLGISEGDEVILSSDGNDADEAISALADFLTNR